MASTEPTQPQPQAQAPGAQGDACTGCGKPLAADQRYCLNCGTRRGDPRVDFAKHLYGADVTTSANGLARAPSSGRGWNPLAAAALLGLLGIMLLVGVLIGKDESDEPAATTTPPAQTTPATGATGSLPVPPATTTPATPPATTAPNTGQGAGVTPTPGGAPESEPGIVPPATKRDAP